MIITHHRAVTVSSLGFDLFYHPCDLRLVRWELQGSGLCSVNVYQGLAAGIKATCQNELSFFFLKKMFSFKVCVCVCVHVCVCMSVFMCVQVPMEARRWHQVP